MSQVVILKRTMVVVLLAGAAAGLLVPHNAPAAVAAPMHAATDHGAVLTISPVAVAPAPKSSLRILPAETPATSISVVGLRTRA